MNRSETAGEILTDTAQLHRRPPDGGFNALFCARCEMEAVEVANARGWCDACLGACGPCRHLTADHLLAWGPFRLCMADGCACGRRALARLALSTAPWLPVLAAGVYLAYHLALWASRGFLVRAW
jgi:hypothetical protein